MIHLGRIFIEDKKEYKIIEYKPKTRGSYGITLPAKYVAELIECPYVYSYKNGEIFMTGHNCIEKTEWDMNLIIGLIDSELFD